MLKAILHSFILFSACASVSASPTPRATPASEKFFTPSVRFRTYNGGVDLNAPSTDPNDLVLGAQKFLLNSLSNGDTADNWPMDSTRIGSTELFNIVYFNLKRNNRQVINAHAHVAYKKNDFKVISFSGTHKLASAPDPSSATTTISADDAVASALAHFGSTFAAVASAPPRPNLYYATSDTQLEEVYALEIRTANQDRWLQVYVRMTDGQVLGSVDFVYSFAYSTLGLTSVQDPSDRGFSRFSNPFDINASPMGWHTVMTKTFSDLRGNNVGVFVAPDGAQMRPETFGASENDWFFYQFNEKDGALTDENMKAAMTNTFYAVNKLHDDFYGYGFTEKLFNFQAQNMGLVPGNLDPVTVMMYKETGPNGNPATFAIPPDGSQPQMNLYIAKGQVTKSAALQQDLVIHEYTHGVTSRITGGGTGLCLNGIYSGSLAEGWSDAMAFLYAQSGQTTKDVVIGKWLANSPKGIRRYPYSNSTTTNPLMYGDFYHASNLHEGGEVWTEMLVSVYDALVKKSGWNKFPVPNGPGGNVVWMHLFMDALSIQSCNPSFETARDSWLQADQTRYGGAHRCMLWKAFASRGFGMNGHNFVNDFTIPSDCR